MEGDVISINDIFALELQGQDRDGRLFGKYHRSRVAPSFAARLVYFGLDQEWAEMMASNA
jgi:pilus assembly protein CpaF